MKRGLSLVCLAAGSPCAVGYSVQGPPATLAPSDAARQMTTMTRRGLFQASFAGAAAAATAAFATPSPARAAAASLSLYYDAVHGFSLGVPSDWVASTERLPDRRELKVWRDPQDPQTLLFVAYTPVRDDFTSLGSFGTVERVAAQVVLPKGELAGVEGVSSRLLSATSERQAYFFDYLQTVPGVTEETHYRTVFALAQGATGGAGAVLVTATLQAPESRYAQLQPLADRVIASYGKSQ